MALLFKKSMFDETKMRPHHNFIIPLHNSHFIHESPFSEFYFLLALVIE